MARFKSFDAALREATGEPLEVELLGKMWQLPGQIPAEMVLRRQRLLGYMEHVSRRLAVAEKDGDVEVKRLLAAEDVPDDIEQMMVVDPVRDWERLVGKDNLAAWSDAGVPYALINDIVQWVWAVHLGVPLIDEPRPDSNGNGAGGKTKAPRKGARSTSSLKDGKSSRRTSPASTASTSPTVSSG